MTCIVGIVEEGRVYIGADSAGVAGSAIQARKDPKIFRNGQYLIGFTTSFRMGQILRYKTTLPSPDATEKLDLPRFMCTKFIDTIRKSMEQGGFRTKDKGAEEGGTFLVGFRGRLFKVESDFQVAESIDNYDAVGSGYCEALGSLYTTSERFYSPGSISPQLRLRMALEATDRYHTNVCPPFIYEVLD